MCTWCIGMPESMGFNRTPAKLSVSRAFPRDSAYNYSDVVMGAMASQVTSLTIVLLNRLFRCRSKKTSKLCVSGLCAGNSPVTGEFPTHRASDAEKVPIWWRHYASTKCINIGMLVSNARPKCWFPSGPFIATRVSLYMCRHVLSKCNVTNSTSGIPKTQ